MQLLKITNIPIKFKIETEAAHLQMKQADNAKPEYKIDQPDMKIHTQNIQVRLDTTELRASLNQRSDTEFARYYAERGRKTAYQSIGENVQMGNQMQNIQDGVTISQIMKQKMMEQPTTYTTFLPAPTDISWEPAKMDFSYNPGSTKFDWHIMRNQMDYIPGKYEVSITQYPKVEIEYLGEPTYVPPSSNPNYEEKDA